VHSRMISGEPIRDENLAALKALSATLQKGKRAVAVVVSAPNFAGGLIQQNDRVDVISTPTPKETKTQTATETTTSTERQLPSKMILWDVRVLAIDLATEPTVDEHSKDEKSKGKIFEGRTATLELYPWQVDILTNGEKAGSLSLALRSALDNGEAPPLPPSPPLTTRLQSTQSFKHVKFGSIDIIELVKSETLVEIPGPKAPSPPAWLAPGKPLQAQLNSPGIALQ
jgi:Flp pilus assembly protein CpaB